MMDGREQQFSYVYLHVYYNISRTPVSCDLKFWEMIRNGVKIIFVYHRSTLILPPTTSILPNSTSFYLSRKLFFEMVPRCLKTWDSLSVFYYAFRDERNHNWLVFVVCPPVQVWQKNWPWTSLFLVSTSVQCVIWEGELPTLWLLEDLELVWPVQSYLLGLSVEFPS